MKKRILMLMAAMLLIGSNVFAANGDLIVDGKVGIGQAAGNSAIGITTTARYGLSMSQTVTSGAPPQSLSSFLTTQTADQGVGMGFYVNSTGSTPPTDYLLGANFYVSQRRTVDMTGTPTEGFFSQTWNDVNSASSYTYGDIIGASYTVGLGYSSGGAGIQTYPNVYGMVVQPDKNGGSGKMSTTNYVGILSKGQGYIWSSGTWTIANTRGIWVENQHVGTNNTNLLLGDMGATGNWSIYNSSSYNNYFAGSLGIGTADTQGYELMVNGDAYVNGTLWYASGGILTSDGRYKKDIKGIDAALDKICNIQGVSYNWNTEKYKDKRFTKGLHYGVIGQDVEKVLPEIVKEDPNGYKGVAYTELIPVLIEAVKEQQRIIETQNKEMNELKVKVQKLEAKDLVATAQN